MADVVNGHGGVLGVVVLGAAMTIHSISHNTATYTMAITYTPLASDSFTAAAGDHVQLHLINSPSEDTGSVAIIITAADGTTTAEGIIHIAATYQHKYTPANAAADNWLPLTPTDHTTLKHRCADMLAAHHNTETQQT